MRHARESCVGVLVDAVKLAMWGVAGGLGLAFLWAREISWSSFGGIEPVVYACRRRRLRWGSPCLLVCPRPAGPLPSSRSSQCGRSRLVCRVSSLHPSNSFMMSQPDCPWISRRLER